MIVFFIDVVMGQAVLQDMHCVHPATQLSVASTCTIHRLCTQNHDKALVYVTIFALQPVSTGLGMRSKEQPFGFSCAEGDKICIMGTVAITLNAASR